MCLTQVNAENADEQSECEGHGSSACSTSSWLSFFKKDNFKSVEPDECLVNAENALEQADCRGLFEEDMLECIVSAESPAEAVACEAPLATAGAAVAMQRMVEKPNHLVKNTDVVDIEECVVFAENPAELEACWDDYPASVSSTAASTSDGNLFSRVKAIVTAPLRLFRK